MNDKTQGSTEKPSMGFWQKALLAIVALLVLVAIFGGDGPETSEDTMADADQEMLATGASLESEPANTMTGPQRNAVRSAERYIEMKGFSRAGLIEQLSSEYGEGYALADATFAVDSLNIDWNEQAAREATSYLEMKGFSCNGLIEQLSSEYGAQYTTEQATYGADQAGAC